MNEMYNGSVLFTFQLYKSSELPCQHIFLDVPKPTSLYLHTRTQSQTVSVHKTFVEPCNKNFLSSRVKGLYRSSLRSVLELVGLGHWSLQQCSYSEDFSFKPVNFIACCVVTSLKIPEVVVNYCVCWRIIDAMFSYIFQSKPMKTNSFKSMLLTVDRKAV